MSTRRLAAATLDEWLPDYERGTWYVLVLAAALCIAFTMYTVTLFRNAQLTGSDFGSYVHMFWTTVTGNGFLEQGKFRVGHPGGSYWGAHFSLTLLAFLPAFALVPRPETLLVTKSLVIAASIPVFWLFVREHVSDQRLAAVLVTSYALNPFLWSAWVFDFQEQALLPLLVFGAAYAYTRERHGLFLALVALVYLTNEFAILVAGGALAGLLVAAWRTDRLDVRGRVLAAGLALAVVVRVLAGRVIDQFSQQSGIPVGSIADPLQPFVTGARVTVGELLALLLARPRLLADLVTYDVFQKFAFFVLLLVPVVFLAVTDESAVGALVPYLAFAWLFAGRPIYYLYGAHYPLYLLPFVYVGAVRVLGTMRLPAPSRRLLTRLFVIAMLLGLAGAVTAGVDRHVLPPDGGQNPTLEAAIDDIPAEASLVTQNDVYPHVATRPNTAFVARPDMFAEYQREHGPVTPEYVLVTTSRDSRVAWSRYVAEAFAGRLGSEYGLYRYEDGVWVFKRGYDGPTRSVTDGSVVADTPPLSRLEEPADGDGNGYGSVLDLDPSDDRDAADEDESDEDDDAGTDDDAAGAEGDVADDADATALDERGTADGEPGGDGEGSA